MCCICTCHQKGPETCVLTANRKVGGSIPPVNMSLRVLEQDAEPTLLALAGLEMQMPFIRAVSKSIFTLNLLNTVGLNFRHK